MHTVGRWCRKQYPFFRTLTFDDDGGLLLSSGSIMVLPAVS